MTEPLKQTKKELPEETQDRCVHDKQGTDRKGTVSTVPRTSKSFKEPKWAT